MASAASHRPTLRLYPVYPVRMGEKQEGGIRKHIQNMLFGGMLVMDVVCTQGSRFREGGGKPLLKKHWAVCPT